MAEQKPEETGTIMGSELEVDRALHKRSIRERLHVLLLAAGLTGDSPQYSRDVEKVITDEFDVVSPEKPASDIPAHQPDETVRLASEVFDRPMS